MTERRRFWLYAVLIGLPIFVLGNIFVMSTVYARLTGGGYHSIPSGAMKPNILIGDMVLSLPVAAEDLERGDIIIFRHPDSGIDYIKRIVGLPGEQVAMKGGIVEIDGVPVGMARGSDFIEPRIRVGTSRPPPQCAPPRPEIGGDCVKEQWIETLPGGRSYPVLNFEGEIGKASGGWQDHGTWTVPPGHVFAMGDNRDNSLDSRAWGALPIENVKSRAWIVLTSWGANGLLSPRFDRFLKEIGG